METKDHLQGIVTPMSKMFSVLFCHKHKNYKKKTDCVGRSAGSASTRHLPLGALFFTYKCSEKAVVSRSPWIRNS